MIEGNGSMISASDSLENASVGELQIQLESPRNFDFLKPELWPLWKIRFERYLIEANLSAKSDADKINTLCYAMGEKTEAILAQVMPDTEGKTLTEVLQAFTDYFCPKKNVILERFRFNSRIQEPDESVDQFVTALHRLAKSCQYGIMKDVLIRDRIVAGLSDTKTSVMLRLKSYLTLEDAVRIARQADGANAEDLTDSTWEDAVIVHRQNDVMLRETDNPWRRGRQRFDHNGEVDLQTYTLYKKVRGVLNKLTPQKFNTLVNQVRALQIDSQERLQGVIDLVFEKAINEPNYSIAYAVMCKELAMMQVSGSDTKAGKEESNVNFRKLIINRCQMEFEKNTVNENARAIKMKEIEACPDPDKKKELLHILNEEERKI